MEQTINLTQPQTEAIATMYTMLASSFPSFNYDYDSAQFNIWKLTFSYQGCRADPNTASQQWFTL